MQFSPVNKTRNRFERRKKSTYTNGYYAYPTKNNINTAANVSSNKTKRPSTGRKHHLRRRKLNKIIPRNTSTTTAKWRPKPTTTPPKPHKDAAKCRELLTFGYCRNALNTKIIETIGLYFRAISEATERAIASADFFANTINNYQNNIENKCPFISDDKDYINLNEYIYIRGGALRDTILSRDINDIDFVIDTITLNNIYYNHLIKYHSKLEQQSMHCSCYLWKRYLNMYKIIPNDIRFTDIDMETNEIKKLEKNIARSEFLLNARFFKDAIINSPFNIKEPFINAIDAINTWEYTNWVLNIDKTLFYNNINLKGARFDIGDEMSYCDGIKSDFNKGIVDKNQMVFESKWNDCFDYLSHLKTNGAISLELCEYENKFEEIKNNYEIVQNKCVNTYNIYNVYGNDTKQIKNELIAIKLPLYKFTLKYSHQYYDFTVNGLRLPLANVYINDSNIIDFNWYSKIFQYSYSRHDGNINYLNHNKMAIKDIKNKIIRQPDLNVLTTEYMYDDYFWRFIKILTKFVEYIYHNIEWKVDEKTLNEIKYAHKNHFKLLDDNKMKEFINRLLFWNVSNDNFESAIKSRFIVFKMINIDDDIKQAFKVYPTFKMYLQSAVNARLDNKKQLFVANVLKDFGYKNLMYVNEQQYICSGNRGRNTYNSNRNNVMYSTRKF